MDSIGYVRVSTDQQIEGISLDNQRERIANYCQYKGFNLNEIIEDAGVSGGKNKGRQGFNLLLDKLETKRYATLVLYSLERLSRDMLTLLALERLLDEYDVELHTVEGQIDTSTPDGFMNYAMRSFLGEMERRQVKYRTKRAMEHMKKNKAVVGHVPFGFHRKGDVLIEHADEQRVIEIVNNLYASGNNLTKICRELSERHIRTRNGKPFVQMQVKRLISDYQNVQTHKDSHLSKHIRKFISSIA